MNTTEHRPYALKIITERLQTPEGRTQLYAGVRHPMKYRLRYLQRWEPGFEAHMYDLVPERDFWIVVGRQSESLGLDHADTVLHLISLAPDPAVEPPHPWVRRIEKSEG